MAKNFYTAHYDSPLGGITMGCDGEALTGLWFDGKKHFSATFGADHEIRTELPVFVITRRWLNIYFSGGVPEFSPTLRLIGSAFCLRVWEILRTIPYGQTVTYGHLAASIARERGLPAMSAQAVGGAVGRNPISLIVPCHRVIGSNGSLTGYAGGVDRKRHLLRMECAFS